MVICQPQLLQVYVWLCAMLWSSAMMESITLGIWTGIIIYLCRRDVIRYYENITEFILTKVNNVVMALKRYHDANRLWSYIRRDIVHIRWLVLMLSMVIRVLNLCTCQMYWRMINLHSESWVLGCEIPVCIYSMEIRRGILVLTFTFGSLNLHLTHRSRDKTATIFQTTFSNAFSWTKMYE